jgi:hypothetical protein
MFRFSFGAAMRRTAFLIALLCATISAATARAQQQLPGSTLPNPRLMTLVPCGGKAGTTVEVTFTGTDLDEPQGLFFSHAAIKADAIVPPDPPADPKKPPMDKKPPDKKAPPAITKFKITIPADVPPGFHDVRFIGKYGISNPRTFVVGDLPEVQEKEPNNDVNEAQRIAINSTVNGAISAPTDVDYFVFTGKKGQRVVVSCLASSIDSRLRPAMEFYDAKGRQLAYNRSYNEHDALLDCTLPDDGDYFIRLYEFTHTQGNAEHYYRLTVSTGPWIDAVHPSVIEPGKTAQVTVYGRNLPGGQPDPNAVIDGRVLERVIVSVTAPTDPQAQKRLVYSGHVPPPSAFLDGFEYRIRNNDGVSNPALLTFARAPVVVENEANDTPETAQKVPVPCEIAGRIEKKHDRDWYAFSAKKGDVLVIDVLSDRLGSPTDMYFILRNPATKSDVTEQDDNTEVLGMKFFTRSDDPPPYRFVVPTDGEYQLMVSSRHADVLAGPRHIYRVRIAPEMPDFHLVVMPPANDHPDACQLLQAGGQYFTVFAWRTDGFTGPITLTADGLPKGVTCPPQILPPGQKQATLVVSAAADAPAWTGEIKVKGTATNKGQPLVREARAGSITWPVPPMQNIPTISRLDRNIVLGVRDKAPWTITATIDKPALVQGEKGNLDVKVARLSPDFKNPIQVQALDLPPALIAINNNQPITIAADKTDGKMAVDVRANTPPGEYTLVLRSSAPVPLKDAQGKPKNPVPNGVLPSAPVKVMVLPKALASVSLVTQNPTVKAGMESEIVVKITRMYEFAGEFKVQVVVPAGAKGVTATEAVIPAGKDEAKFMLKAAPDTAPGAKNDFVVKATASYDGKTPTTQEVKFNVNVVK